jgi:tripartite-type tricarboxylate transporter receptor subunit TctC
LPHVKRGSLKLLAVTSRERLPTMPDLPTMGEYIPGFEYISFYGLVGPTGIPKPIVGAMNATINNDVLTRADVRKALQGNGSTIVATSPEGFQKTLDGFVSRVQKLVKEANLDLKPKI